MQVRNELPSKFKAYRFQQHRWSCGPANLFRKMTMEIIFNKVIFVTLLHSDPMCQWLMSWLFCL